MKDDAVRQRLIDAGKVKMVNMKGVTVHVMLLDDVVPLLDGVDGRALGRRGEFVGKVECEVDRAYGKHGREQWGRHEFYAVLKEEVDELWDAVKKDLPEEEVEKELIQVAAMCLRYYETGNRYGDKPAWLRKIMD